MKNEDERISPIDKPLCKDGYSVMVIDELTTIRNGRFERICHIGGESYAKARAVDDLFKDTDRIVEGVRNASQRILADQIERDNKRLGKLFGE